MKPPLLRTSERTDWKRCPWLWWQHWVNGISPTREPTWSVFGTCVHRALAVYYRKGRRQTPIEEVVDVFLDALDGEIRRIGIDVFEEEYNLEEARAEAADRSVRLVPAHELGPAMLRNYVNTYGDEPEWEVIHTEQPFQINVPHPHVKGQFIVTYAGTWDVLMRHRPSGRYWLWDHKTCKAFPNVGYLDLNDQAGAYPWVAREVLIHKGIFDRSNPKHRISGIIFNYLKKYPPDDRPTNQYGEALNKDGTVSKRQPAPRFMRHESPRTPAMNVMHARRVQAEALVMAFFRDGELPIYKTPREDCPRCIIFDMCQLHEQGDDWELLRDELYVVRDPYKSHHEDMEHGGIQI